MSRLENQQNIATRGSLVQGKTYDKISFWFSKRLIVHKQQEYTHPINTFALIKSSGQIKILFQAVNYAH